MNKMKKLISLLLCVLLLCAVLPVFAEEEADEIIYASDFAAGKDGWEGRSMGGVKLRNKEDGSLYVTGRMGDWSGPAYPITLPAGTLYWISAEAMANQGASVDFVLTVVYTKDGAEQSERIAQASGNNGAWVTLCGSWKSDDVQDVRICLETSDASTANFYIRNVVVQLNDPRDVTEVTWEGELPVLKDVYAGHFDVGTCFSGYDAKNPARCALVASQYNIITPENELKPDSVLDVNASKRLVKETGDETAVAVHFDNAKPILDFAKENGLKVHGHVLLWHNQTPEAFFHEGYEVGKPFVSREVMLARLDNYIRLVFEYMDANYPGLFASWDVVNEAVADGSTNLRESNWTKVVGQDFISRAFEIADKYAPEDVLLCYNDYSTPYEPKLTGICNLLEGLVAEGHIDGYGFQTHYSTGEPSVATVKKAFDRISALGLKLRVSEMDIKVDMDTDKNRAAQAQYYKDLFELYLTYDMEAVQVWGVCDSTSWIAASYPLPFDANLNPKPAFFSIVEAVAPAGEE